VSVVANANSYLLRLINAANSFTPVYSAVAAVTQSGAHEAMSDRRLRNNSIDMYIDPDPPSDSGLVNYIGPTMTSCTLVFVGIVSQWCLRHYGALGTLLRRMNCYREHNLYSACSAITSPSSSSSSSSLPAAEEEC